MAEVRTGPCKETASSSASSASRSATFSLCLRVPGPLSFEQQSMAFLLGRRRPGAAMGCKAIPKTDTGEQGDNRTQDRADDHGLLRHQNSSRYCACGGQATHGVGARDLRQGTSDVCGYLDEPRGWHDLLQLRDQSQAGRAPKAPLELAEGPMQTITNGASRQVEDLADLTLAEPAVVVEYQQAPVGGGEPIQVLLNDLQQLALLDVVTHRHGLP